MLKIRQSVKNSQLFLRLRKKKKIKHPNLVVSLPKNDVFVRIFCVGEKSALQGLLACIYIL
jgi:hypothetical protein